jgi:hypothetical protein
MDVIDDLISCLALLTQTDDMHAVALFTKRVSLASYVELRGIEAMPDKAHAALAGCHRRLNHAMTLAAVGSGPAGLWARTCPSRVCKQTHPF